MSIRDYFQPRPPARTIAASAALPLFPFPVSTPVGIDPRILTPALIGASILDLLLIISLILRG